MRKDKVFIIAEAGVNHNGSLSTAMKLIDAARESGADAVKFQTFKAEALVTPYAAKAAYQKKNTASSESQYKMLKALELSESDHVKLKKHCEEQGVEFLSSPFDRESVDFLHRIGIWRFKIPSGEITNLPYLRYIALKRRPMLLSTGMSTMKEVLQAVDVIFSTGNRKLTLLHCVTDYPAPYAEINLRAMLTMGETTSVPIGYSDHTPGIEIAIAAAALGATVIEKHLTLDRNMSGPDHKASTEPDEFRHMVDSIRNVELAMGNGIKAPARCEVHNMDIVRKSVVAARDIAKGEIFTRENLDVKRPGTGIRPSKIESLYGRKAKQAFRKDQQIKI